MNKSLDLKEACKYLDILDDALHMMPEGCVGGNLHILLDDCNYDDKSLEFLDKHLTEAVTVEETNPIQLKVEQMILDLVKSFKEEDREKLLFCNKRD